jgi:hypothetical protein
VKRRRKRRLIIRSSRVTRILSLGLIDRTVTVDPDKQVVTVRDRRFWFGSRVEKYPFDLITAVSFHFLRGLDHSGTVFGSDRGVLCRRLEVVRRVEFGCASVLVCW